MSASTPTPPTAEADPADAALLRLAGCWTLDHATDIGEALRAAPDSVAAIDASAVERLDSLGVLQLLRYAKRRELDYDAFRFRDDHRALVSAIEDIHDERPKTRREFLNLRAWGT